MFGDEPKKRNLDKLGGDKPVKKSEYFGSRDKKPKRKNTAKKIWE